MTTVKRDGSEIRFFLLLFLFYRSSIHVQSKNDQAGYTIGRHFSLSRNLLLLLHHKTNMAVFLFEKTNSVLSSFPDLENKQKSYFFQSRFTHAE